MLIRGQQFQTLRDHALQNTERDISNAISRKYSSTTADPAPAIPVASLSETDLTNVVHQIVEIGISNGFTLRWDLYMLVDAFIRIGPDLISEPVLDHNGLDPSEKIQAMLDLHYRMKNAGVTTQS